MPEFCTVEKEDQILIVTINRPDVLNSLHPPANFELAQVFDDFAADPALRVAILTGAGDKAFSSGNDLKYTASGASMKQPPSGFGGLTSRFDNFKPIIAAVNGFAFGGGFEITLACDLIIAAENATFSFPEPKVGLAALAGGLHRLPRQIPLKQAMGIILTGRRVSAQEAMALGLVNEIVPRADLMAAARRWAEQILECAPLSIKASKQTMLEGLDTAALEEAMSLPNEGIKKLLASEDLKEGPLAFAQKRKPQWKGR